MGMKRNELSKDEYDQITEDIRGSRKRFADEVLRDIAAWLYMHWERHADRSAAASNAEHPGNNAWAAGVIAHADQQASTIAELYGALSENWAVKNWHRAQTAVEAMITATDKNGRPIHPLGTRLAPRPESANGPPQGDSRKGMVEHTGDDQGGGRGGRSGGNHPPTGPEGED